MSAGSVPASVMADGILGDGNTGPREKLSKAYTATRNIQDVRTKGEVEAGTL